MFIVYILMSGLVGSHAIETATRAASRKSGCGCQCANTTFKDKYGKINGNCKSTERGAVWCYVDPKLSDCNDLQKSERINAFWSYQACATPDIQSSECRYLGFGSNGFSSGGSGSYGNSGQQSGSGGFIFGGGSNNNNGFNSGNSGFNGGNSGFNSGNSGFNGGNTGSYNNGNNGFNSGNSGFNSGNSGFNSGNSGLNGGNNGFNGGNNGFNGGNGFNSGSVSTYPCRSGQNCNTGSNINGGYGSNPSLISILGPNEKASSIEAKNGEKKDKSKVNFS